MYAHRNGYIPYPLGEGTNTYFGNSLQSYLFIQIALRGMSLEERGDRVCIRASSGELFDTLVSFACKEGLWGIENLSGIPGTVGAGPVQNIGAYGEELKDVIEYVEALDLDTLHIVQIDKEACEFGYRDSLFKKGVRRYVITSVALILSKTRNPVLTYAPLTTLSEDTVTLTEIRELVLTTRASKLPEYRTIPNAGSFFKNPVVSVESFKKIEEKYPDIKKIEGKDGIKIPSAWLIEHVAKKKGVTVGNVGSWEKQPLVLVNYGGATSEELNAFAYEIIKSVQEETGITLEQEVRYVVDEEAE
jgi:UDP-N-acetylmuramate dehydrogenase